MFWVIMDLKDNLFSTVCYGQGHPALDQVTDKTKMFWFSVCFSGITPRTPHLSDAGAPELQVGSQVRGVEGQDRLPCPAGHVSFDAAWDVVWAFWSGKKLPTFLGNFELLISQLTTNSIWQRLFSPWMPIRPKVTAKCPPLYASKTASSL